jgi:hypothetical protein
MSRSSTAAAWGINSVSVTAFVFTHFLLENKLEDFT